MRARAGLIFVVLGALALAACSDDDGRGLAGPPRDAGTSVPRDAAMVPSGLPCDVATVMAARCTVCHGATPLAPAPMSLLTYEDLTRPSITMPGTSVVALSIARMRDARSPMPPGTMPTATAAEIATLEAWVAAGTPRGTCTDPTDPYGTPVMCSSGTHWTLGDEGSELMRPGRACISCHATSGDPGEPPPPAFSIAGTVYPSAHEPDDCNGVRGDGSAAIVVEVRGHDGNVQMLYPNEAGNFFSLDPIALPLTAVVHYQGRTRAMVTEQPSGDCNSCHTEGGTSMAPGRILLP